MIETPPKRNADIGIHSSPRIAGAVCDGCLCLDVLTVKRKRSETERYWCLHRRGYFNPLTVDDCENAVRELEKMPKGDFRKFEYSDKPDKRVDNGR